jgi:hypothetical protein
MDWVLAGACLDTSGDEDGGCFANSLTALSIALSRSMTLSLASQLALSPKFCHPSVGWFQTLFSTTFSSSSGL